MNNYLDTEKLLELMHDYLNQYGEMDSFLQYCADDCGLDKGDVEEAIEEHFYGAQSIEESTHNFSKTLLVRATKADK